MIPRSTTPTFINRTLRVFNYELEHDAPRRLGPLKIPRTSYKYALEYHLRLIMWSLLGTK